MNILTEYKERMIKDIKRLRPDVPDEKIEKIVVKKMKEQMKIPECELEGTRTNVFKLVQFIREKDLIITPFGALYRSHENAPNELAGMVDMLLKERKVAKKQMFKYANSDPVLHNNYKMIQLTLKLLANSFYGASIEANSIFYHPYFGPSITFAGQRIIMTAVNIFEKFCGNNIMFRSQDDVLQYMINILEEDYIDIEIDDVDKKDLYFYLVDKTDNNPEMVQVAKFIKSLSQVELNRIYYRNNLLEIVKHSKTVQDLMSGILGNDKFLDPNEPPEEMKENIDRLWEILENWVYYNNQDFYCWDNADVRERKTVLTIDTDSNFLYLQPFVNTCFEQFGLQDNDLNRMTTTNICGYLMGKVIANQYWTMTTSLGIPQDKRPIINMKNEFYYKRIMLTKNKKNYGGMVALQEGNLVPPERGLDIKGLPIKKVSVNKDVREHFTDILQNDILLADDIRLSRVVYKYQQLESEIRESLAKGETRFTKPDKINMIETYKLPFGIQSVRGTLLWNAIYPEKEISIPTKVNTVKLAIDNIFEDPTIPDFVKEATGKLFKEFPDLESKGTTVICVPKDLDKLDDWIVDHLDVDTIVNDNMKPGLPILEAIGFRPVTANKTQIASNIIHL